MSWLVENFVNVFRERKMEIIILVRDTKVCRETRLTDFSNQGVWHSRPYTHRKSRLGLKMMAGS